MSIAESRIPAPLGRGVVKSRTKHKHWWIEEVPEAKRTVKQWFKAIRAHVAKTPEWKAQPK